jgi:hypothetical protein
VARRAVVTETTKRLARIRPGPTFTAQLLCLGCGWQGCVTYSIPREVFRCPSCARRKAVRDDEEQLEEADLMASRA